MSEDGARQEKEVTGVDLAYGLVQSSYEWAVVRLNAVENRIQVLMVFSASFVLTAPALVAATGNTISLGSYWFYFALGLAVLNLIIGTVTRAFGGIRLLALNKIANEWLSLSSEWFMLYAVEAAAEHFEANLKVVNRKGQTIILMTILFLLETLLLAAWGISQVG